MVDIIDNKELRDQLTARTEVLNKVKKLFLIPNMDVMTIKQVAKYFEVDTKVIDKVYRRNKNEIDLDGTTIKKQIDFDSDNLSESKRGSKTFDFGNNNIVEISNFGTRCFSKRAILRIAMLLRDSEVAQEVRTQLLNVFEKTDDTAKVSDIEDEQTLYNNFAKSLMSGNVEDIIRAFCGIQQYHQRHIDMLTKENEELSKVNKLLADGINTWDNKAVLNAMIRSVSVTRYANNYQWAWNIYYKRLSYKCGISLKMREGNGNLIDRIKPDEWMNALQVAASWLIELNIDVCNVINTVNANKLLH